METDGAHMLHGQGPAHSGLNRWFDATLQLIVTADGSAGLCIEHSVAEGIVVVILKKFNLF
jgi:choline O-acetyltransferase